MEKVHLPLLGEVLIGRGYELRRVWRKAVRSGIYSYYVDEPQVNPVCVYVLWIEEGEVFWDNLNKHLGR